MNLKKLRTLLIEILSERLIYVYIFMLLLVVIFMYIFIVDASGNYSEDF